MAAVLAGGAGAVLSHRAAAALWQLRPYAGVPEVTLPRVRRDRRDIRFHCSVLPFDEVTECDGVPVTTVPRTLLDLAAVAPSREVERARDEAEYRRLDDELSLQMLVDRYRGRAGTATLRALLGADSRGITRRELEERFAAVIDEHALPRPDRNVPLELQPGRFVELDCVWRDAGLVVELDGRSAHTTRARFDSDRERDRLLTLLGWRVVRVTWAHLRDRPADLAADLRSLLKARYRRAA